MMKCQVAVLLLVAGSAMAQPTTSRSGLIDSAAILDEAASNYGPINPYNFGYDVHDENGNHQYRKEESDANGVVRGTYGYTDAYGLYRLVDYVADASGFKANIRSNEPGVNSSPSANVVMAAEQPPAAILEIMHAPRLSRRSGKLQAPGARNQANDN
ncbi:Cuticle protein 10.9 [Halotydeus destructor]|nr:Cuticle protein 10.9 [Halotydeus destructor]